jgi:hypothetical protein
MHLLGDYVEVDSVHESVVIDRACGSSALTERLASFSPDRRTSGRVTLENGTTSIESTSMRADATA